MKPFLKSKLMLSALNVIIAMFIFVEPLYSITSVHSSLFQSQKPLVQGTSNAIKVTVGKLVFELVDNEATLIGYTGSAPVGSLVIPDFVTYNDKTYLVTRISNNVFQLCERLQSITFPSNLEVIGDNAFNSCFGLKELNLPATVTTIGQSAFGSCDRLTKLILPKSLTKLGAWAFSLCKGLTDVEFSDSIKIIENYTFSSCVNLKQLTLPASIEKIDNGAFFECYELMFLSYLGTTEPLIEYNSFEDVSSNLTLYLPNATTGFSSSYWNASSIKYKENIPEIVYFEINNIEYIATGTQATILKCRSKLSGNYTLPQEVTYNSITYTVSSIGSLAFADSEDLISITLPSTLSRISAKSFMGCTYLGYIVYLGSTEPILSTGMFENTSPTLTLYLPNATSGFDQKKWGVFAIEYAKTLPKIVKFHLGNFNYVASDGNATLYFGGEDIIGDFTLHDEVTYNGITYKIVAIGANGFKMNPKLTSVTLPSCLAYIGSEAFYGCSKLSSVVMPSVKSIGPSAFESCNSLTQLYFSDDLESIKEHAFLSCAYLKKINLPSGIKEIGNAAFYSCSRLNEITCLASKQPTIGFNSFGNGPDVRILNLPNAVNGFGRENKNEWGHQK